MDVDAEVLERVESELTLDTEDTQEVQVADAGVVVQHANPLMFMVL